MGCSGCSTGRGCSTESNKLPGGCKNNGACGAGGCNKLNVFDWLANMELPSGQACDVVEVRFKNSRKEFYKNVNNLSLSVGDIVAVEASPGHDIGIIAMAGELVRLQMKKKEVKSVGGPELKKIYRKAKQTDIDKWKEAQALEVDTMYKARTAAVNLKLQMKISDVEYQGDKTKAIFYYTADDRVDFRELIKKYAEQFRVRIEMKQIGARQEASRLGGIGSCGRELCCSTWLTDFRTVSTSAARYQQLSLNPQKLAGQCGKLKCCLNYELDSYLDAIKDFPDVTTGRLKTQKGEAFHQKTDIFGARMFFSYVEQPDQFIPLPVNRVKEIVEMNKTGQLPPELLEFKEEKTILKKKEPDFENVVGQDSLTRFDRAKNQKRPQGNNNNRGRNNNNRNNQNKSAESNKGGGNNPKRNNNPKNNNRPNNNRPNNNRPKPQGNRPPQGDKPAGEG